MQSIGTQISLDLQELPRKRSLPPASKLSWIQVADDAPYFVTDEGEDWTPIGQNDAITWPELKGVFLRKDMATAEAYLRMLVQHGVTCLRLMLEYCHGENRYFEKPVGRFQPNMIKLWDDIFLLCEKHGLRILLTPYDTFWMWRRWSHHPYKRTNGGPCDKRTRWLLCNDTRQAIKARLAFAAERWGRSGVLFAWDLWNEIHPAHADNCVAPFEAFVADISTSLRRVENRLYGRSHPQTVSVFGPTLEKDPLVAECAFRHPDLDFASIHFYESNTIDNPRNTVDAALSAGRLTREALAHSNGCRPFFDSEHGPIHAFKDKHRTLPEPFDDEYFRHMQWAHFAAGGAGGGMRWANRHPHSLTAGMRIAQKGLARFLPLIRWQQFRRINLNNEILVSNNAFAVFGCGDTEQAVIWLLRINSPDKKGMVDQSAGVSHVGVEVPGMAAGRYRVTTWDTKQGVALKEYEIHHAAPGLLKLSPEQVVTDLAFAISRSL